jgi:hypothetical protein
MGRAVAVRGRWDDLPRAGVTIDVDVDDVFAAPDVADEPAVPGLIAEDDVPPVVDALELLL